jgi:hypothetical protein
MKTKIWVGAILLLFVLYLVVALSSAMQFIMADEPLAKAIGVAALVVPLLGVWILIREVLFGTRTQKMASILASEGLLPEDNLPRTPAGRIIKASADEDFVQYKEEVEANPESWKSWHRLALAYDASGDRRRARDAMRTAIGFYLASVKAAA